MKTRNCPWRFSNHDRPLVQEQRQSRFNIFYFFWEWGGWVVLVVDKYFETSQKNQIPLLSHAARLWKWFPWLIIVNNPDWEKKKHFNASSHNVLLQFSLPAHPFLILWLCKKKKRLDWGGGCVQVPSARLFNNVPKQGSVDEGTYPCVPVCVSRPSVSHLKCSQELWWNGCRNNKEAFRGALVQVYTPCPCKATKQGDESSCDVICTCCRGRKSNLKLSKSQSILIIFNTLNEE